MKIDIKTLMKNGKVDDAAIERLAVEKPILPPVTKDKLKEFSIKVNRDRYVHESSMPDRLPTFGHLPMPIDEHDHIGMYESKQNIYLTLAIAFNKAMQRIEELEEEVAKLKAK